MLFHTITNFIAGSIFNGTFTITICLLIVNLFNIKLHKIDKPLLVRVVNTVLLLGVTIYLGAWLMEIFVAYYSGGEYEQYTVTNRLFGPYWWAALLIKSILLPQILWIRRLRRSFIATVIIVSVWAITSIPIISGEWEMRSTYNALTHTEQLLAYGLILTGAYFILRRKTAY